MIATTRTTRIATIRRIISIGFAIADHCEARITEDSGRSSTLDTYLLERIASDFGIAFRVRKCDSEDAYDVHLNQPGDGHSCDCR